MIGVISMLNNGLWTVGVTEWGVSGWFPVLGSGGSHHIYVKKLETAS